MERRTEKQGGSHATSAQSTSSLSLSQQTRQLIEDIKRIPWLELLHLHIEPAISSVATIFKSTNISIPISGVDGISVFF